MDDTKLFSMGAAVVLLHILINGFISKEIHQWVPSIQKRIALFICVWFVPFIGVAIAYKVLDLGWFKQKSKKSAAGQNVVGGAFLEVDAIFNPGQKHVIAASQKEVIEQNENGEMYNKNKPDVTQLKSSSELNRNS